MLANRIFVYKWQGIYYGPNALPVTQPIMSKHWGKYKALIQMVTWPQPFFIHHQTANRSTQNGHCSLYRGSLMPVYFWVFTFVQISIQNIYLSLKENNWHDKSLTTACDSCSSDDLMKLILIIHGLHTVNRQISNSWNETLKLHISWHHTSHTNWFSNIHSQFVAHMLQLLYIIMFV